MAGRRSRSSTTARSSTTPTGSPRRRPRSASRTASTCKGAVRELRFHLARAAWRVTYWLAPGRRIVLLTVFRKTRDHQRARSSARSPPSGPASSGTSRQRIFTIVRGEG